jgi:hypothetical protein
MFLSCDVVLYHSPTYVGYGIVWNCLGSKVAVGWLFGLPPVIAVAVGWEIPALRD